jgi:hypothetical protein
MSYARAIDDITTFLGVAMEELHEWNGSEGRSLCRLGESGKKDSLAMGGELKTDLRF